MYIIIFWNNFNLPIRDHTSILSASASNVLSSLQPPEQSPDKNTVVKMNGSLVD